MIDLSFYPVRTHVAGWLMFPNKPEAWLWTPSWLVYPSDPSTIDLFTSTGWVKTGTWDNPKLASWVLSSQLSDIRFLSTGEGQPDELWTPAQEKARVESLPVLLAFTLTSEQKKAAVPGPGKSLITPRALPPANLGEIGIILAGEGDQPSYKSYQIGELSHKSQELQRRIKSALSRLTSAHDLERSAWLEQWEEIQSMARDLARDYLAHDNWKAHENMQQVKAPHVPNVFKDGYAWTALNMGLQGTQSAIYHNDSWKEEPGIPAYHDSQFEHGNTRVWLQDPTQTNINAEMASEELTRHLAALSDLEADIVTIQIAQAMAAQNDLAEAILTPEAILEYRGLAQKAHKEGEITRYSGHREEDREKVIAAFERTTWIRLKVQQWVNRTRGGKGKLFEVESAYVLIKEWLRQPTLDDTPPRLIAWRYQMGTWLAPFMDEAEAGRYFGVLMKKTLEYNIKNELVEKRLARYFAIHLCIAAKNGAASIKRYVGKLLEECALPIDHRNPQRTKDRFEKALAQLIVDGIIGDWKYTDASPLSPRQWLDDWRGRSIIVTLGPRALQAYQPMLEKAQARRTTLAAPQQSKKQNKYKTS